MLLTCTRNMHYWWVFARLLATKWRRTRSRPANTKFTIIFLVSSCTSRVSSRLLSPVSYSCKVVRSTGLWMPVLWTRDSHHDVLGLSALSSIIPSPSGGRDQRRYPLRNSIPLGIPRPLLTRTFLFSFRPPPSQALPPILYFRHVFVRSCA